MQCLNLDAMVDSELCEVIRTHESGLYKLYAAGKRMAIEMRLNGAIGQAKEIEESLDHTYARLPEDLKW